MHLLLESSPRCKQLGLQICLCAFRKVISDLFLLLLLLLLRDKSSPLRVESSLEDWIVTVTVRT